MTAYPDRPDTVTMFYRALVLCLSTFLLVELISLNLGWQDQAMLGGASILLGIAANRFSSSRAVTVALMLLSIAATLRYGWWRVRTLVEFFTDESNKLVSIDSALMFILISAEAYTVVIMVLGYMQTAYPLGRGPLPMPRDESKWPHVDVLIPTYNEALELVRYTALAAINIDYPPDKLHVYILDDGTRTEFRDFCREACIGYITRTEHGHAKAGNINHALTQMSAPFVAIFDCDHVPTRSFLQMTLGWMLAETRLAMLQTPHHFYSPDPFERNLLQYKTIPNEAELFYGIVQDGNDLWNATFFCGSCALLRRSVLDEVGGIAVETVTEDAHTSLRMQKHGYNTAYINMPQAAGLATETLAAHVGQRVRWARGMIQILRTDNPLFAKGMKLTQRLCYFNAMAHFLYAVPRLVFLLAPLAYLLLQRTIIPGYWAAILAYAIPHLIMSSLTNSRIQGRHRHSFWNEIYEAVLAPYILVPTLLALINPKLGKFNVTGKGSTLGQTYFDSKIAAPTKWMLLLNFIGLGVGAYRIFVTDPQHTAAILMNLFWVLFNIVILGVAAAVALEQKQRRSSVRIEAKIRIQLQTPDARMLDGETNDMSVGGASIQVSGDSQPAMGERLLVSFPDIPGDEGQRITAQVVGLGENEVRLAFYAATIPEQETLTRALYSRADAWLSSTRDKEVDRPLVSLGRVMVLSFFGLGQVLKSFFQGNPDTPGPGAVSSLLLGLLLCLNLSGHAAGLPAAVAEKSQRHSDGQAVNRASFASSGQAKLAADSSANVAALSPVTERSQIQQVLSLKDLGLQNPIEMRGPHSYYSVQFTIPHAMVPRHAALRLIYAWDPSLDPQTTSIRISLNGSAIASLSPPIPPVSAGSLVTTSVEVPDALVVRSNTLTFEFTGSQVMQREDLVKTQILCRITLASTIEVNGDRLRMGNSIDQLPLPIFDSELQSTTVVPFAFLVQPSQKALGAAGMIASWLGLQATTKPARFSVTLGSIPVGNVVLLSDARASLPSALQLPAGSGPLIALRANPSDELGSVLVVAGDDGEQLDSAAQALILMDKAKATGQGPVLPPSGDTMSVANFTLPPVRALDDAPRWLPASRTANLARCTGHESLQTDGTSPIPVYFHFSPDLYFGDSQSIALRVHYRYEARAVAAGSALRVVVNGVLVSEIPLPPGQGRRDGQRVVRVPVANLRPFGNTIFFNFDFIPVDVEAMQNGVGPALSGEILCDCSLDLHGLAQSAPMPNLELFANAGFPLTRSADLSATTIVLPSAPSAAEIELFLHLMSHFGAQTGYPALRLTVAQPNTALSPERDYLILGTIANQPAFNSLDALLPITLTAQGVSVKPRRGALAYADELRSKASGWWSQLWGRPASVDDPTNLRQIPEALIEEVQSPVSPQRSVIIVALRNDASAGALAQAFQEQSQSHTITGTATLLLDSGFVSYRLGGSAYHVGDITWLTMLRIWFLRHYLLLLVAITLLTFLLGRWVRDWLAWRAGQRLILATPEKPE